MTYSEHKRSNPLPPSSSKLLPAPTPVVNPWGTRALFANTQPIPSPTATPVTKSGPAKTAESSNDSFTGASKPNTEEVKPNDTVKKSKKPKEVGQWPFDVPDEETLPTLKEHKKTLNSKEKWVHYDATIVISSSSGPNKKNGVNSDRNGTSSSANVSNGGDENGQQNKTKSKKSKNRNRNRENNRESKDTKDLSKLPTTAKETKSSKDPQTEPLKKQNGHRKSPSNSNEKQLKDSKQKSPSPKREKIVIQSATSVESNASESIFDDSQLNGSVTLDSAASELTQTTEGKAPPMESHEIEGPQTVRYLNDIPKSQDLQNGPSRFQALLNQQQHQQQQFNFQPQFIGHPGNSTIQQNGPNSQFMPPQVMQQQQPYYNHNPNGGKNMKHRNNSEPLTGNRSVSGGSNNSRRNNNRGNGNNNRHSITGANHSHNQNNFFNYPQVNYGFLPILNQQMPYGQLPMGHILPPPPPPQQVQQAQPSQILPHSRSSSQSPIKESFLTVPFQGPTDQNSQQQQQQQQQQFIQPFNGGMPFSIAPMYHQPFISDTLSQVIHQIQYYFSVDNLIKDTFIRKHMNSQGFIPIDTIMEFRRMKVLAGGNHQLVFDALMALPHLEVRNNKVRLREGFTKWLFPYDQREPSGKLEEDEEAESGIQSEIAEKTT
ncbi:hypothetical protein WICPIJ_007904 [Wickerhamomyces pijperi]|uniref:HTH La-type RNA-binding domain-containing protein n=1 Tax=Wickerhamomyces pijperi TaxID=599730 RepID=A0A9P8Q1I6_WICPI|nr:hypothetical protein WICPIJ_007904 [Wickerhamomyces pijperi]